MRQQRLWNASSGASYRSDTLEMRIEDYAIIGDTHTVALVGGGSIDWLCVPRFDSGACFAALLGNRENGRWRLAPRADITREQRCYRDGSLVLESTMYTADGVVRVTDCMLPRRRAPELIRQVEGISGAVPMTMDLLIRFDYGSIVPWVRKLPDGRLSAIAGSDALILQSDVPLHGEKLATVADFVVRPRERKAFVPSWYPSHEDAPKPIDADAGIADCEAWWNAWSSRCKYRGPYRDSVLTSLTALKALTYAPTGGIVAAATTSLPEWPGGVRNWDYRYCWLRDATFTLYAFRLGGHHEEAEAWRDWLLRAVAGDPAKLQIMYGIGGERRLTEYELPWLSGFGGSKPVRVGNSAAKQLQLDVYGEVMDALFQANRAGLPPDPAAWRVQEVLLEFLETAWECPDEGLWEVRGPRQQFTHSKVMTWVAFDRAVKLVEQMHLRGSAARWRTARDNIHQEVCRRAWNSEKNSFTQAYASPHLDASLLLMPQVGFLPARDPRVIGTVNAIERELMREGLVLRYLTQGQDGLPAGEGVFIACSFWLADCYTMLGRTKDAQQLFERLLGLRNDVGLLSEEYDVANRRMLGNFPQAFSHVGLVNTAFNLTAGLPAPADERAQS